MNNFNCQPTPDESWSGRSLASPGKVTQEGWMVHSLPGVRGWLRREWGPAHFPIFLPLSGIWDTCHLCLHLSIIIKSYFLSWLMLVALSPSILLKFSYFPLPSWLVLNLLTDIFPLAANCEHHPHPLYQGFCFYSEMASNWRRCSAPRGSFSHSQAGITLTGQEEFIIQWSISQPMPREY